MPEPTRSQQRSGAPSSCAGQLEAGDRGDRQRRGTPPYCARTIPSSRFPTPSRPRTRARSPSRTPNGSPARRRGRPSSPASTRRRPDRSSRRRSPGPPDGWLPPAAVRALLKSYGIPSIPERIAASAEEAVAIAAELGFPAVVKTAAAGVHKSELGGVAVDLRDAEAVRAAAERIGFPVLVQPFLGGRTELARRHRAGPGLRSLVAFGPGGGLAELIGEASFRLAPLDPLEAEELVTHGKTGLLVAGFRGAPASDTARSPTSSSGLPGSQRISPS